MNFENLSFFIKKDIKIQIPVVPTEIMSTLAQMIAYASVMKYIACDG